jgi:tyrosine-protein kinase Etk/Wzc
MLDDSKSSNSPTTQVLNSLSNFSDIFDVSSNTDNELTVLTTKVLSRNVVDAMELNVTYYQTGFFDYPILGYKELYRPPFKVKRIKMLDTVWNTMFDIEGVDKQGNIKLYYTNKYWYATCKNLRFDKPFFVSGVGTIEISLNGTGTYDTFNQKGYSFSILSTDEQASNLESNLAITIPDKDATAISVILSYDLPKKGQDIVNRMLDIYMKQSVEVKNRTADSTIAFINGRLLVVSKELGGIEGKIEIFKQKNNLADIPEQAKMMVDKGGTYDQQLIAMETQIGVIDGILNYLKQNVDKRVAPTLVVADDPVYTSLVANYNTLLFERDRQLLTSTPGNPYIKNLDDHIAAVKTDIITNLTNTKKSFDIRRDDIKKSLNGINGQMNTAPVVQRLYLDLSRQQQIEQTLYEFLLQKREETEISEASNISSIRVIDPAKSDFLPYSPHVGLSVIFALFLGLFVPIVGVYASDVLNTKILTKDDITKVVGAPIVGEISHSDSNNNLVVTNENRTAVSEQFRAMRTNLQFFLRDPSEKVILVTSTMSGEGKSFMSLNIAMVLAITGKKVLLMELDLRKPNLASKLNMNNPLGFTNYIISNEVKPADIVFQTEVSPNLYLISSGPIPPNPSETIINPKVHVLMDKLKEDFDFIIMDAPPIGIVTDAQLLNEYSDLTLYVIRQKYTFKSQLHLVKDLYVNKKMKNLGLVINDIATAKGYGYAYGYGYGGYGYGHGYGYHGAGYYMEDKKKGIFKRIFSKK